MTTSLSLSRSLKHYFLLDQSDFMVHFMDISEEEMKKNIREIKTSRLESLLEISLRITSANSDPYKDDLRVKLFIIDLKSMIMRIQNIDAQNGENGTHVYNRCQTRAPRLTDIVSWQTTKPMSNRTSPTCWA